MSTALAFNVKLESMSCGECGGSYALSAKYIAQRRQNGGYWNCPYCKCSWGYGESEVDRLKKEVSEKENQINREQIRTRTAREDAQHQKNKLRAEKGAKTKLKKRIAAGVCPCCNRTFKQLANHMKNQHPEYK